MGWFTKSKDKKKKEEQEKKEKEEKALQQKNNKPIEESKEQQPSRSQSNSQARHQQQQQQLQQQQQYEDEQEQQQLIKEEDIWIYESILQFLVSPVFRGPANQFIDDRCLYFENTKDISEQHKETFKDYKTLMDELVISLSQDIGVEPDKIMEICELGLNFRNQRKYFIYFLIYFHFDDFIKTMAKRNIDLEQQAFESLQQKNNPQQQNPSRQIKNGSNNIRNDDYERAIQNSLSNTQINGGGDELQKAILASQNEFEKKKQLQDQEDDMLQEALRLSKLESENRNQSNQPKNQFNVKQDGNNLSKKIQRPEQKKQEEDEDDLIQMDDSDDDNELFNNDDDDDNLYYDNVEKQPVNNNQQFDQMLFESRQNLLKNLDNMQTQNNNNDNVGVVQQNNKEESMEERKERLKKQRELLLEKKRMERATELDEFAGKQIQHQELLMQDEDDDTKSQMEIKKKKELMNKIKADIVGNKL